MRPACLLGSNQTRFVLNLKLNGQVRELFIHREAMVAYVQLSTSCRLDFWCNEINTCRALLELSSPNLVDKCAYGNIAFPCIKISLVKLVTPPYRNWYYLLQN